MPLVLRLAALLLLLLGSPAARAQEDVGILRLSRAIAAQEQLNADLRTAAPRLKADAAAESLRLSREEAGDADGDITLAALRQARFEADSARTRLSVTQSRQAALDSDIAKLDQYIADATKAAAADPGTLEAFAAGVLLDRLRQLRAARQETADLQRESARLLQQRMGLLRDRAALLQARIRLVGIDEEAVLSGDPLASALQDFTARTARDSVRLANEASVIEPRSPAETIRKAQLELQADEAFMRSSLRAADIDLLGIERQLAYLRTVSAERDALPARLATDGLGLLRKLSDRLDQRLAGLADVRRQLADQATQLPQAVAGFGSEVAMMRASIYDLGGTVDGQEQAIQRLGATAKQLAEEFRAREATAEGEALLARNELPAGAEAWQRIGRSAMRVPQQLLDAFARAGEETVAKATAAARDQQALAAGAVLALLLAALAIRHLLQRRVEVSRPESTLGTLAAAIHDSMLTLVPAAAWWAVAAILEIDPRSTILILGALAIWPAVAFILLLARRALFRQSVEGLDIRRSFYRRLRWTMILSGILAGLVVLTSTLPLTPALADLVHRSAMVCVLLITLPGLQLRALILTLAGGRWHASFATRAAAQLSLLVPLVLAAAAALGLAGYLTLAWSIIEHFLWFGLFIGLLLLALGILADLSRSLRRRISERYPDTGYFWIINFLEPAYRLIQLLLVLAAGSALLQVYGWTEDTPVVREFLAIGRMPVLSLGDSALSLGDIVLAVVMVALCFWIGGWSQQVSYNLALTRVRDLGIRQSLSTFVQYVVIVLGLLLTLKIIGLDLTALTVFAASIGVGIGFGMQNVVNNFISGILLLVERPLRATDIVTIGGETGEVTRIGIRSLTVMMFDRKELIIPNSAVIGNTFTNWTRTDDVTREVLTFKISYRDDPRRAAAQVEEVARSSQGVLANPPPKATVYEFTDTGILVRLQYYVRLRGPVGGLDVRADILQRTRDAFVASGVTITTSSGEVTLRVAPPPEPPPALPARG